MSKRETALKALLPIGVLAVTGLIAWALIASAEPAGERLPDPPLPLVRVLEVEPRSTRLVVRSQGTVGPRTETELVSEVAGRVVEVAPGFAEGGYLDAGQWLVRIDAHDYRAAVREAEARVAQAELRVAREEAEADVARREWASLGEGAPPSPLTLREPQIAEARASLEAARAAVARAERDLARTEIRAPYDGRVRAKFVDVGQFVAPGARVASVYAIDFAEVRLPVPDDELAFVDLPLSFRDDTTRDAGPPVRLHAEFAGKRWTWDGRIVRTAGEIDPRSRMVTAVARVAAPYDRGDDPDRPPLAAGMFVEAEILGREVDGVFEVPRAALRPDGRLLIVDEDDRLRFREVGVLRRGDDTVAIDRGLAAGDRVCLSPLVAVTDGMRVRVADDGAAR